MTSKFMKRIVFVLIAASLIFWLWPEKEVENAEYKISEPTDHIEEVVNVPTPSPRNSIKPSPQPMKVQQPIPTAPGPQNDEVIKVRKLPPGIVEFVVTKDNWAVTHGDILLGKLQSEIKGPRGHFKPTESHLWETSNIPYAVSAEFPKERVMEIAEALEEISGQTKVNFYMVGGAEVPKDYIIFLPSEDKCASYLGKIGGQQAIFLKEDCGKKEILHEAMHALGFVHEQSRSDRDRYVKINWQNIEPGYENQFDIAPEAYLKEYKGFVFAFDYNSVMLYSSLHFSKDKKSKTIVSVTNKEIAPMTEGLSPVDIQRINYLYQGR
jgi:hypothetical protein